MNDNGVFYQTPVDKYQTWNGSTQESGVATERTSCRGCNRNLTSNSPESQYQRQKIIQNTVRVQSSLYTMNLAALTAYHRPSSVRVLVQQAGAPYYAGGRVNWNQMSDQAMPSVQHVKTASGSSYRGSSTKHTIVRNRPGAMSPGGVGVDIKHNSYERYLNRIKGKAPVRRGVIPPNYGQPIPFNPAFPIYGGKVIKTSIINRCKCPEDVGDADDKYIYNHPSNDIQNQIYSVTYHYAVGDNVWAKKHVHDSKVYKATILDIVGDIYVIRFENGIVKNVTIADISIFYNCRCDDFNGPLTEKVAEATCLDTVEGPDVCTLISLAAAGIMV